MTSHNDLISHFVGMMAYLKAGTNFIKYFRDSAIFLMITWFIMALSVIVHAEPNFNAVHGNWCGTGNRSGPEGDTLPPVDVLDTACMQHDICITVLGVGNCRCDHIFLHDLRHLPYPDLHQAIKARAIYDTMSWVPCLGIESLAKPLWFFGQLKEDFSSGGPPPWDTLWRLFYTTYH